MRWLDLPARPDAAPPAHGRSAARSGPAPCRAQAEVLLRRRSRQIRRGFAADASQVDGRPDLGSLRALAEREELADATGRLTDAYGRPLRDDDPLKPLATDLAWALTEAGFTLHHCALHHPLHRLGGVCLLRSRPVMTQTAREASWSPGRLNDLL